MARAAGVNITLITFYTKSTEHVYKLLLNMATFGALVFATD